jgi:hypothetical protein
MSSRPPPQSQHTAREEPSLPDEKECVSSFEKTLTKEDAFKVLLVLFLPKQHKVRSISVKPLKGQLPDWR